MAIIAGYAGVGKSYFAAHTDNVKEITSMPRSWVLPSDGMHGKEAETEKGRLDRVPHPMYPMNMVLDVLHAELEYDYAVIPTSTPVIEILQTDFKREIIFVYPEIGLKEEYRARYQARGNNESFINLFADQWEERIEAIRMFNGTHFRLPSGAYLSDLKDLIFAVPQPVRPDKEKVHALEQRLEHEKQSMAMFFQHHNEVYAYPISNIESSHDFICKVANLCRQREIPMPCFVWKKLLFPGQDHIIHTEQAFLDALEKKAQAYDF